MANDKDIKIGIGTEGDTSGAEEVEKAIDKVVEKSEEANAGGAGNPAAAAAERDLASARREGAEATREASDAGDDMADVFERLDELQAWAQESIDDLAESTGGLTAEEREAAAAAELMAAKVDALETSSRKLVAVELARTLNEVSESFRGISPELDQALTGTSNFLNTFAATGDPVKATAALVVGEIGNMIKAFREYDRYTEETADRSQEWLERIKRAHAALVAQVRSENMAAFFDAETQALDRQIAAIGRRQRVIDAQREAENAVREARGVSAAANARPGDVQPTPQEAALDAKAIEIGQQLQKTAETVANANKALEIERDKLATAQLRADESASRGDKNAGSDAAAVESAKEKVADLEEELKTIELIAAATNQKILAEATTAVTGIGTEVKANFTDLARNLESELKAEAQAAGGQLSASARAAMQSLQTILADGVVRPEEIEALRTIAALAKSSRESADNAILNGFQDMVARNQATERRIAEILKRLDEGNATGIR